MTEETLSKESGDIRVVVTGRNGKIEIIDRDVVDHELLNKFSSYWEQHSWGYTLFLNANDDPEVFMDAVTRDPRENEFSKRVLESVSEYFGEEEMRLLENLPSGERRDGLADFIRDEILDVGMGHEDMESAIHETIQAFRVAKRQLEDVVECLGDMELELINESNEEPGVGQP